ncbi:8584_t:CDS:2, partial [Gigaspora margarita]
DISNENNIMLTYANRFLKILVQGQFQRLIKDIEKTINEKNIRKLKFEKNERIDEYTAAIKKENKGLKEAIEIKDRMWKVIPVEEITNGNAKNSSPIEEKF